MIDFGKTTPFLDTVFLELLRSGIDVSYYQLDHICYRVKTVEEYYEYKNYLLQIGELLSEAEIAGRPIATYKLHNPIRHQNRKISILELPAPREGKVYETGFEHVEFVIDEDFKDFMSEYPEIDFKTKALEKEINPDISLKLGEFSVKFHKDTLENVIEFEQSSK